mgnify:CR=1 FL=1
MCLALLAGCVVVCAGQESAKYVPWLWGWIALTVLIGGLFVVQGVREHLSKGGSA